jgi:phosphoglycerate kinase
MRDDGFVELNRGYVASMSVLNGDPRRRGAIRHTTKLRVDDIPVHGLRVFIRADLNVPLDKADPTKILDTALIDAALPTIKDVLDRGAQSVVLASHLGCPDGMVQETFSMAPVAKALEEKLGRPVTFVQEAPYDTEVVAAAAHPEEGSVILLENLRFHVEEEGHGKDADGNDVKADETKVKEFRALIRKLADVYVNDAFGHAHRAPSSIVGDGFDVRVAGALMSKEMDHLAKVTNYFHARPVLAILGGTRVIDKIQLIFKLLGFEGIGGSAPKFLNQAQYLTRGGDHSNRGKSIDILSRQSDHWRCNGPHFPEGNRWHVDRFFVV